MSLIVTVLDGNGSTKRQILISTVALLLGSCLPSDGSQETLARTAHAVDAAVRQRLVPSEGRAVLVQDSLRTIGGFTDSQLAVLRQLLPEQAVAADPEDGCRDARDESGTTCRVLTLVWYEEHGDTIELSLKSHAFDPSSRESTSRTYYTILATGGSATILESKVTVHGDAAPTRLPWEKPH